MSTSTKVTNKVASDFVGADYNGRESILSGMRKADLADLLHKVALVVWDERKKAVVELVDMERKKNQEKAQLIQDYEAERERAVEQSAGIEDELHRQSQEIERLKTALTDAIHARNMYAGLVTATANACQADTALAMTLDVATSD